MNHSPEPWRLSTEADDDVIKDASGRTVTHNTAHEERAPDLDDMRRIVACVNFCKGISTKDLMNPIGLRFQDGDTPGRDGQVLLIFGSKQARLAFAKHTLQSEGYTVQEPQKETS